MDKAALIGESASDQLELARESIAWAKEEKRSYLRQVHQFFIYFTYVTLMFFWFQRLETRLASLLCDERDFDGALAIVRPLASELKQLDDKLLLVEVFLIESRAYLVTFVCVLMF